MKEHEAIYKRKSIRKYKDKSLEIEMLDKLTDMSKSVKRLNNQIDMDIHVLNKGEKIHKLFKGLVSNYVKIKSPHYLVVTSEKEDNYLCNIGYAVENLILEMTSIGIATCWVGASFNKEEIKKIVDIKENQEPIILVSFGEAEDFFNMYRIDVNQFNRKNINEISKGVYNSDVKEMIEAARIAPSACNLQPWSFEVEGNNIKVFKSFPKNIIKKKIVETYGDIDVGIAISHIIKICDSKNIDYTIDNEALENSNYICTIKLC